MIDRHFEWLIDILIFFKIFRLVNIYKRVDYERYCE